MKIVAWSLIAVVISRTVVGADPVLLPLVATTGEYRHEVRVPGGYYIGLTKPLMVNVNAHIWGPGIETPSPGGPFRANMLADKKPRKQSRPAISRPDKQR